MAYRVTQEEIFKDWERYRADYPQFVPFSPAKDDLVHVARMYANLITTQNGMDFDDYVVTDANDKTQKYLSFLPQGARLLIHGVGTGREIIAAKALGYNAIGTTLGSRNVEFGKRYLGLTDEEIRECMCEALPFSSGSFDAVAGYQIFEHAMNPLLFLLEQGRVLRFGGTLTLEWPPAKDYSMDDNPHHQVCFTPGQAKMLFLKAGFGNVKLFYDDMTEIPESDWWRGDQNKMLCVQGTKIPCGKDYVLRHWSSR